MPEYSTTVTIGVSWRQSQDIEIDIPNHILAQGITAIDLYIDNHVNDIKVPETGNYVDDSLLVHTDRLANLYPII